MLGRAAWRVGVGVRFSARRFCVSAPIPEDTKFQLATKNRNVSVSENDIEEMFEFSAREVGDLSDHWEEAMNVVEKTEQMFPIPKISEEDLLKIRATQPTCTLASLVNQSETLQTLVDLGVQLYVWDKKGCLDLAAKLDFNRDIAPIIDFLTEIGVTIDNIGRILTQCPRICEEREEDLKARVAYLLTKGFTPEEIATIVSNSPSWLTFSVRGIDARLGFFQKTFGFLGSEVRALTVSRPTLITWKGTPNSIKRNLFSYNEEMGFSKDELKEMVLKYPDILKVDNELKVLNQFECLHNEAKIPHEILVKFPESLLKSPVSTRSRLKFLEALGRDQLDPEKPNFVTPAMLTVPSDAEFCQKTAKCSEDLYDKFLRTL